MTYEEAARILDPETSRDALCEIEYYGGVRGEKARLEACNEACRVAAKVLREPRAVRLDETGAQAMALAAEVSELRQQNAAWISVKDRLPDDNERVITYRPNEADTSAYKYCVMCGWSLKMSVKHREVSHWMPIPEPPKED